MLYPLAFWNAMFPPAACIATVPPLATWLFAAARPIDVPARTPSVPAVMVPVAPCVTCPATDSSVTVPAAPC